jgi:hypothetical protein
MRITTIEITSPSEPMDRYRLIEGAWANDPAIAARAADEVTQQLSFSRLFAHLCVTAAEPPL